MIIFYKELKYALLQNLFGNKIQLLKYDCIKCNHIKNPSKQKFYWINKFKNYKKIYSACTTIKKI